MADLSGAGGGGKPRASPDDDDQPIQLDDIVDAIIEVRTKGKKPTQRTVAEELGRSASSINRALQRLDMDGNSWVVLVGSAPLMAKMRAGMEAIEKGLAEISRENETAGRIQAAISADRAATYEHRKVVEAVAARLERVVQIAGSVAEVRAREAVKDEGEQVRASVAEEGQKQMAELRQSGKLLLEGASPELARKLDEVDRNNERLGDQIAKEEEARLGRDEMEAAARRRRDVAETREGEQRTKMAAARVASWEQETERVRERLGTVVGGLVIIDRRISESSLSISRLEARLQANENTIERRMWDIKRLDGERAAESKEAMDGEVKRLRAEFGLLMTQLVTEKKVLGQELRTELEGARKSLQGDTET